VLANIDDYYRTLYAMLDNAVREGFVTAESRGRWRNAESIEIVMQILVKEGVAGERIP
jgi:predicted Rossmann-fold nucleotide-binding protein